MQINEHSPHAGSGDQDLQTRENSIITRIVDELLGSITKLVGKSSITLIFRKLVSVETLNMLHDSSPFNNIEYVTINSLRWYP